jgi:hypothetical protein
VNTFWDFALPLTALFDQFKQKQALRKQIFNVRSLGQ